MLSLPFSFLIFSQIFFSQLVKYNIGQKQKGRKWSTHFFFFFFFFLILGNHSKNLRTGCSNCKAKSVQKWDDLKQVFILFPPILILRVWVCLEFLILQQLAPTGVLARPLDSSLYHYHKIPVDLHLHSHKLNIVFFAICQHLSTGKRAVQLKEDGHSGISTTNTN